MKLWLERPRKTAKPVAIKSKFNGGLVGGSARESYVNLHIFNGLCVKLEAGTGIEPVYMDLQSSA